MTAAEPPDETDSTKTNSPWRRPRPGWTLFDSLWGTERRDEAELDPALNGHSEPADGGVVVLPAEPTSAADPRDAAPQDVEVTIASPSTAPSTTGAESSATTALAPQAGANPGAALGVPADAGPVDATVPIALPTSESATVTATANTIAIAIAIAAVMAEAAKADGVAPAAPSDAAPRDSEHDGSPVLVAATAVDVSADVEASAITFATGAVPDAPEQPRHARHAKRATSWTRVRQVFALFVLACVLVCVGIGVFALVQGTWAINPVLSGSMRPGFAVGGVVISERVPVDQLALRDVIVFRDPLAPSEQIVHRIVGITVERNGERIFVTQGDANVSPDPWRLRIPEGTAYRVRWSLPLLGYVANAYDNHRGISLMIAGLLLVLVAIPTIARARRRKVPGEKPAAPST